VQNAAAAHLGLTPMTAPSRAIADSFAEYSATCLIVQVCLGKLARLRMRLARDKAGSDGHLTGGRRRDLSMWAFFSRRLRMWLLLAIALPLTRALVHRLALAAERRDPSTRTAKALHQADSTVTAVSRRTARKAERRKAGR
jgi:hypothetical protein